MTGTSWLELARPPPPRSLLDVDQLDRVEEVMRRLCDASEVVGAVAAEQLENGGKRIRARLALAAAAALDVDDDAAIGWAAAVELLHNATLVHDDVQDGDVLRRGRATAWAAHGVAQAINAGDLMLMLPALAIDAVAAEPARKQRLVTALCERAIATVRGQGADLRLRDIVGGVGVGGVNVIGVDAAGERGTPGDRAVAAYLRCIEGKTGELFALPVEGAALLAGRDRRAAAELARPFFHLGVLFQLQDDVLDLFGDKGRDSRGGDVREGKISALVVEHLRLHPGERDWLLEILGRSRDDTSVADVDAVIARFAAGGARDAVLARISALCTLAHHEVAPPLRALVVELTGLVLAPIQHCFADGFTAVGPSANTGVPR